MPENGDPLAENGGPSAGNAAEIQIPRALFTAFRLQYAPADEVAHLAKTVFLGRIPDTWLDLALRLAPLAKGALSLRLKMKSWIRGTALGVKSNLLYYRQQQPPPEVEIGDGLAGLHEVVNLADADYTDTSPPTDMASLGSVAAKDDAKADSGADSDSLSTLSDVVGFEDVLMKTFVQRQRLNGSDLCALRRSRSLRDFVPQHDTASESGESVVSYTGSLLPMASPPGILQHASSADAPVAFTFDASELEKIPTLGPPPARISFVDAPARLRPDDAKSPRLVAHLEKRAAREERKRLRVAFAQPVPASDDLQDYLRHERVTTEHEHRRAVRRVQKMAARSRGRAKLAKNTGLRLKVKVVLNLLRRHRAGEIIRVDKMLVLVKRAGHTRKIALYTDTTDLDTIVLDHWREYYVVLRKTDLPESPLLVQLFETEKGRKFLEKPQHKFLIRSEIGAGIYCLSDKTISVVDPGEHGVRIFVMNTRFTPVAFKWLYMIKEILDEDFFSVISVTLGGLNASFLVNIPPDIIRGSLDASQNLTLRVLSQGYEVEKDVLLRYLEAKLHESVSKVAAVHTSVREWQRTNFAPALGFKFYDRIEWCPDNSRVLFVQFPLLQSFATLEWRQETRTPLSLGSKTRPIPIEGFLLRLTNTRGRRISNLRAFYKVQYFFTSENILFFCKLFRGIPPSPENKFLRDDTDRIEVCSQMPRIYTRLPFELDLQGHIPWLEGEDFAKYDTEAVEELSRKIQHIVGSQAMLDLTLVSEIRPFSRDQISGHAQRLQAYLWYSSPTVIEDDEIADCGFEIKLLNGSSLRLLAPDRFVRDEWIVRLNELVAFWKDHQAQITESMREVKIANQKKLHLEDYVDSNARFGLRSPEVENSIANCRLFTNSALAMSSGISCSGYLFQKQKKHSSFAQFYVVLCPGYLVIYSLYQRSRVSGLWKKTPCFERYLALPVSECYVYTESSTEQDLVGKQNVKTLGESDLPRLYADGWKSCEEDANRCFTLWFGGKRALRRTAKSGENGADKNQMPKNPGLVHMARKAGLTGKIFVFLTRSRQEREWWVYNILLEINRFYHE